MSGRSVHGRLWAWKVLALPNAAFSLPTFMRKPPGRVGNVMKASSISASSGPKARKKSARAYGSTTAWSASSASSIWSDGCGSTSFSPIAPRKLPMTAMSGLKTFAPD